LAPWTANIAQTATAREDEAMQPWRFTTWLDLLDHWQSLVAGVLAFFAAVIVVGGGEFFARCKERREVDAIRASLAVEIQQFIDTLLRARAMIQEQLSEPNFTLSDLRTLTDFSQPVVYPAMADRIGLLGPLAKAVSAFYADVERIKFAAKLNAGDFLDQASTVVDLIEKTCRATPPLVDALPLDEAVNIKARIEEMAKPDQPDTTS
jgi:hypothetical protein